MLVTQSAAELLAPGGDVLGKYYLGLHHVPYKVVGITNDVIDPKFVDGDKGIRVWWPQDPSATPFKIKMEAGVILDRDEVVTRLKKVDKSIVLWQFFDVFKRYQKSIFPQTLALNLSMVLAAAVILLISTGIFSVSQYSINMQRYELGVRIVHGAKKLSMYKFTFSNLALPLIFGLIFGISVSYLNNIFVAGRSFSVDPSLLVNIGLVMLVVSVISVLSIVFNIETIYRKDPMELLKGN